MAFLPCPRCGNTSLRLEFKGGDKSCLNCSHVEYNRDTRAMESGKHQARAGDCLVCDATLPVEVTDAICSTKCRNYRNSRLLQSQKNAAKVPVALKRWAISLVCAGVDVGEVAPLARFSTIALSKWTFAEPIFGGIHYMRNYAGDIPAVIKDLKKGVDPTVISSRFGIPRENVDLLVRDAQEAGVLPERSNLHDLVVIDEQS